MENANESEPQDKLLPVHHVQQELCSTRPLYRQGRKLTAVKVYTVNNESQHLFIYQVPKINLSNELKTQCLKFGNIEKFETVSTHKTEIFTESFHVQFERIQSSRIAKRFLDNKSFYGEILHVCYAPEYETLFETKNKLIQRQKDVLSRLQPGPTISEYVSFQPEEISQQRKKKHPALPITEKRLKTEESDKIWNQIPSDLDPRRETSNNLKTGFKKHFQIVPKRSKGVQYGPQLPDELGSVVEDFPQPAIIKTTLLPTAVIKKYEHNTNKRIIFKKGN